MSREIYWTVPFPEWDGEQKMWITNDVKCYTQVLNIAGDTEDLYVEQDVPEWDLVCGDAIEHGALRAVALEYLEEVL